MKICLVGKYPPIQGGVSTRTFSYAHALAERGHCVTVITNAKEVEAPYHMYMRTKDWELCEATTATGFVRVRWTEPADRSQHHIPMTNPVVSKLVSLGVDAFAEEAFDVVFSYYAEPYGIAGHLIAEITGRPHVTKTAGSDAGRLWRHPQIKPLYDHVFQQAEIVICGGPVATAMAEAGVDAARIVDVRDFAVDANLFVPDGPVLDVEALQAEAAATERFAPLLFGTPQTGKPCFGVYGKLSLSKGTNVLLAAMRRLIDQGRDVGLLVMGHDRPRAGSPFRNEVERLALRSHVLQLPFLPNWRVPEFIRRCIAVCCLEQDFPVAIHAPITPREVLGTGRCLIISRDLVCKLPAVERMVDGYNCFILRDAHNADRLAERMAAILDHPSAAVAVGRRGRDCFKTMERRQHFPDRMERTLQTALRREPGAHRAGCPGAASANDRLLPLTCIALATLVDAETSRALAPDGIDGKDIDWARSLLQHLPSATGDGNEDLFAMADVVRLDLCLAEGSSNNAATTAAAERLMFRFDVEDWFDADETLTQLLPVSASPCRVERFEFDANVLLDALAKGAFEELPPRKTSYVVVMPGTSGSQSRVLVIDEETARVLDLCDGAHTVASIAARQEHTGRSTPSSVTQRLRDLFELGLIGFTREKALES